MLPPATIYPTKITAHSSAGGDQAAAFTSGSSSSSSMPLVIAKTVLPDAQKFYLALGRIFGIGRVQGLAIAEEVGISKEARVSDVKANHVRQVGQAQPPPLPPPTHMRAPSAASKDCSVALRSTPLVDMLVVLHVCYCVCPRLLPC